MSLYQKHRPTELEELKGNENTISALNKLLSKDDCPHAFLLSGPTGCGKTTLGRIIGSKLNCIGSDFREVNSADFRGIDTIRDIIKQTAYKPLEGACRVWMIDECHRLTADAQSALLKVLEDCPAHVYFILCTTDPQKLLPTIIGRCSQFTVQLLSEDQIASLVRKVAKLEGEKLDKEVWEQIAIDSQGHARNALQILEQVLAVEPEQRFEMAKRSAEEQSQTIELCRALLDQKGTVTWKKVALILTGLQDQDPETIRKAVLGYCKTILLKGNENQRAIMVMEIFLDNLYSSGFPGLIYYCYSVMKG
jgi:DNA polymerase-3 subunit gamma/tau